MIAFRNLTLGTAVAAMALFAGGTIARAQQSPTQGIPSRMENAARPAANTINDRDFARRAAEGNLAQIQLGQLAEQKGETPVVKEFGKRMVRDHTQSLHHLQQAAARENFPLPNQPSARQRATYENLEKMNGASFDKAYASDMVTDHTRELTAYRRQAADGHAETIKSYASTSVPVLEQHLKMARNLEHSVEAQSPASGSYR